MMKKYLVKIFNFPWYFAAFAMYPALTLLVNNITEVRYIAGIRALVFSVIVAIILFLIFHKIYKSWHRAAFTVTTLTILTFSYGHIYDLLPIERKSRILPYIMVGAWLFLAVLILILAGWHKIKFRKASLALNISSLGLVIALMAQVCWWSIPQKKGEIVDSDAQLQKIDTSSLQKLPDIYYIIVDSYGRSDLLKKAFQIDNSNFIQKLESMGFYIADCSQSNYDRTDLSLGSSLNMGYLQNLDSSYMPENLDRTVLWESINQSAVRFELENAGYETVAFATGFAWSELTNADVYFSPSPVWSELSGFETLLIRTTPARHLEDLGWINLDEIDGQRYRERTQLIIISMEKLAQMPGPKFVFIHIIPPHPPFVYGPDGTPTNPAAYLDQDRLYNSSMYSLGYKNEVSYIDRKLEVAVSTLIKESISPPIIILQGDHAPWMQTGNDIFKILNAYYVPGHEELLYPTISPVNTFRFILNAYIDLDYQLLPDVSYYSPVPNIYEFTKVSNPCMEK
jgi:hypothetical protein